jgi:hypothetical protein
MVERVRDPDKESFITIPCYCPTCPSDFKIANEVPGD